MEVVPQAGSDTPSFFQTFKAANEKNVPDYEFLKNIKLAFGTLLAVGGLATMFSLAAIPLMCLSCGTLLFVILAISFVGAITFEIGFFLLCDVSPGDKRHYDDDKRQQTLLLGIEKEIPNESVLNFLCGGSPEALVALNGKIREIFQELERERERQKLLLLAELKNLENREKESARTVQDFSLGRESRLAARDEHEKLTYKIKLIKQKLKHMGQPPLPGRPRELTGDESARDIILHLSLLFIELYPGLERNIKITEGRRNANGAYLSHRTSAEIQREIEKITMGEGVQNKLGIGSHAAAEVRRKIEEIVPFSIGQMLFGPPNDDGELEERTTFPRSGAVEIL
ncbi:MAG: hypothetical protein LBB14_00870 [Puniceicoccales bacterium]|jgi:hypothetical protein|nr:hypothetical protein [Puniceicoccales bacterium]